MIHSDNTKTTLSQGENDMNKQLIEGQSDIKQRDNMFSYQNYIKMRQGGDGVMGFGDHQQAQVRENQIETGKSGQINERELDNEDYKDTGELDRVMNGNKHNIK